jgi:hypothetical protein
MVIGRERPAMGHGLLGLVVGGFAIRQRIAYFGRKGADMPDQPPQYLVLAADFKGRQPTPADGGGGNAAGGFSAGAQVDP